MPRTLRARSRPGATTLQRHVSFFDDNGDRAVDVAECARGLKALGLPIGVAEVAAVAIVVPLIVQTRGSVLALSIDIENIQKGKHDSDTGILDKRGRFNARRFEKVFGACSTVDRNGDKAERRGTRVGGAGRRAGEGQGPGTRLSELGSFLGTLPSA